MSNFKKVVITKESNEKLEKFYTWVYKNEIVNDDNEIVNDSPQRSEVDRESRWNQKQFIFDLLIYNEK